MFSMLKRGVKLAKNGENKKDESDSGTISRQPSARSTWDEDVSAENRTTWPIVGRSPLCSASCAKTAGTTSKKNSIFGRVS